MAYGNNQAGSQPRAHFQLAGGTTITFSHPYLIGALKTSSGTSATDTIDISACCKLEGRYFEATPNQDSARQVVMIDGSTATITNKLLNGTITMPVVRTTGLVATGDFISALHLIKSVGDTVGGLLTKTDYRDGNVITRVYYGVTVRNVPDDVSEGMDVPVYNVQLVYAGWIEAQSKSTDNKTVIWAVGNKSGLSAYFSPYPLQNADGDKGTQSSPLNSANNAPTPNVVDSSAESGNDVSGEASADALKNYTASDVVSDATLYAGV